MANPFVRAAQFQDRWEASFAGAERSRLTNDWPALNLHPDQETRYALRELRARARDLRRNNPYAKGLVEAFSDNIIGWNGIRLKPMVADPAGKLLREINWEIERAWKDWGSPESASVDGVDSWLDLQRLIIETWVTDGEVFIRKWSGWDNRYAYALQIIDADQLDESFDRQPDSRGVEIRQGVELDAYGRRLAYHFFKRHPSEARGRERVRIPADEIIHFFVRYRPGQTRGFSLFAPVLTTVKHIDGMTEAELVASRVHASKMGWITNNTPEAIAAYASRLEQLAAQGKSPEPRKFKVAPALVEELMPGQGFESFDPTHPNTAFGEFLKVCLRGVARGFSVSYLTLTGDVAEANYSSMRAGLLPERDHWRILQVVTSGKLCRPVQRPWLSNGLLSGAIRLPSPVASDYYAAEWRGRGWKWVDPLKDAQGHEKLIELGMSSRTRGAHEQGDDYEEIVDELAEEQAYAEAAGVDVSVSRNAPAAFAPMPDEAGAGPKRNGNRIEAHLNGGSHGAD